MKIIKQLLFAVALVVGLSVSASAQDKKPPKKEKPPVIVVEPKKGEKPKEDKPKDDKENKGKKPETFLFNFFGGVKINIL